MLIAIVILGLGLVMIATMFPVAWSRARDLTEYTSQVAVSEGADTIVKMLTRVDGFDTHRSSFAGDLIFMNSELGTCQSGDDVLLVYADTRVHALHLENILVARPATAARPLVPDREKPWTDDGAPGRLEKMALYDDPLALTSPQVSLPLFVAAQVAFESRVQPPMPLWDDVEGDPVKEAAWYENLDTRRYAWAVLHRLREQIGPEPASGLPPLAACEEAAEDADTTRNFDFYYVTLRRPKSTLRYARQNPDSAPDPSDLTAPATAPAPLGPDQDVLFPSPWRVQVFFPDVDFGKGGIGIPSVVDINTSDAKTADFVVDMFPVGAMFVDERNGELYRVTRQKLKGADLTEATVTLDREVLPEELDENPLNPGTLVTAERLRTVWVFPPPVQPRATAADPLVFDGKQPVVGIDVRTRTISPVR